MNRRNFMYPALASAALALAAALSACGTPPADLDLSLRHPSAQGRFIVELEPPPQGPAIGQMHSWRLKVSNADGSPVRQARIVIDGGMPQHGHGLPTQPRATRELAPGIYLIEGMKFSMTGWWDFRLDIGAGERKDRATFNVVMGDSGLKR